MLQWGFRKIKKKGEFTRIYDYIFTVRGLTLNRNVTLRLRSVGVTTEKYGSVIYVICQVAIRFTSSALYTQVFH